MAYVNIPRLQLRDKTYHYRRRVPDDVAEIINKAEWRYSLHMAEGHERQAIKLRDHYNRETDALIDAARTGNIGRASGEIFTPQRARAVALSIATDWGYQPGPVNPHYEIDEGRFQKLAKIWGAAEDRLRQSGYSEKDMQEAHGLDLEHPGSPDGLTALLTAHLDPVERNLEELLRDGKPPAVQIPLLSEA